MGTLIYKRLLRYYGISLSILTILRVVFISVYHKAELHFGDILKALGIGIIIDSSVMSVCIVACFLLGLLIALMAEKAGKKVLTIGLTASLLFATAIKIKLQPGPVFLRELWRQSQDALEQFSADLGAFGHHCTDPSHGTVRQASVQGHKAKRTMDGHSCGGADFRDFVVPVLRSSLLASYHIFIGHHAEPSRQQRGIYLGQIL